MKTKLVTIEIRKLFPSKGKRISPDGNCLFSSLSHVITGTDYYHTEILELLIQNLTLNIGRFNTKKSIFASLFQQFPTISLKVNTVDKVLLNDGYVEDIGSV